MSQGEVELGSKFQIDVDYVCVFGVSNIVNLPRGKRQLMSLRTETLPQLL